MNPTLKMLAAGGLVAATLAAGALASSTPASAQWCRWHRCGGGWGGPFAAGVLGGLAVGAIAGAATAPYYAAPPPPPCRWVRNAYPYDAYGRWIGYRSWVCY